MGKDRSRKLVTPRLVEKCSPFCATLKVFSLFTTHKLSHVLRHVNPDRKISSYSFPVHFNIVFPSKLKLSSGCLPFKFSNETQHASPFHRLHLHAFPFRVFTIPKIMDCEYIMKLLVLYFSRNLHCFLLLKYKIIPPS